jgi:hypothetical protein
MTKSELWSFSAVKNQLQIFVLKRLLQIGVAFICFLLPYAQTIYTFKYKFRKEYSKLQFLLRLKLATIVIPFLSVQVLFSGDMSVDEFKSFAALQKPLYATIEHPVNYTLMNNNSSKDHIFGTIASLQNDEKGDPSWIVSGDWRTNILTQLTGIPSENSSLADPPLFDASFDMVLTNGSAKHQHSITNFTLAGASLSNNNMTLVFNGSSTVSMMEGPVENVLSNITIMNYDAVSIWLDPAATNNHFGDTPIFGTVGASAVRNGTISDYNS